MQGFIYRHLPAALGQISGTGEPCGAGANHRGTLSLGGWMLGHGGAMLHGPVGHKAFQPADTHRFALDAADTFALALGFLGADASADGGQAILGTDGSIGTSVISLTRSAQ